MLLIRMATDNIGVTAYEIYRNGTLINTLQLNQVPMDIEKTKAA
ncbi:hypothetical protein SAMN05518672_101829 [Chitinophaga sp. CF118]|nr:hypothetical protein [Chitinophaga sp. CF118]SFD16451.1 hypothetical protein SAMN05518672_101829 [Chitinophaga sp. CF118]